MAKLCTEEEEKELFLEEYIKQVRLLSGLSDTQIKMFLRLKMVDDPEWFVVLRDRYKKNMIKKDKQIVKGILDDFSKSVRKVA